MLFKNPDGGFHTARSAPDTVPRTVRKAMKIATCIGTPAFTGDAYSNCCCVGAGFWRNPPIKSGSTAPWSHMPKMTVMWRFRALIVHLSFALQEPVSTPQHMESALPVDAGAPMHSSAQIGRFMALC